jgi:hypothetical protein
MKPFYFVVCLGHLVSWYECIFEVHFCQHNLGTKFQTVEERNIEEMDNDCTVNWRFVRKLVEVVSELVRLSCLFQQKALNVYVVLHL